MVVPLAPPHLMPYRTIDHHEALQLLEAGTATVIDARTPGEYEQLGHIPGAWLLPVDLMASAPAILPAASLNEASLNEPGAILVYCEHGVRSRAAAELLVAAGIGDVLNLSGGLAGWRGPREFGPGVLRGPSSWLIDNADLLPRGGKVLDVACGRGRHALLLASAGFEVTAVDRQPAIDHLSEIASRLRLTIDANVMDLETEPRPSLGSKEYDLVVVFNYLHRPLMAAIKDAVKPGGRIFYETFTTRQAERGHPTTPDFLLKDGELSELMTPFAIIRSREGDFDGRFIASVVAERPQE
jgi:rhodanese-related sulfurtransferase